MSGPKQNPSSPPPTDNRSNAAMVRAAYVKALGRKVLNGEVLTKTDLQFLDEQIEGNKPSEDAPKFAKSQVELAGILDVDRKTIGRWLKKEGNPGRKSDGRYNVEDWRKFKTQQDGGICDDDIDVLREKARNILLQNQLLEHRISVARHEFVASTDVEKEVGQMIVAAKTILLSGPQSLAPQVVGVSIPEAETILKDWLHEALSKLQSNPLGTEASHE